MRTSSALAPSMLSATRPPAQERAMNRLRHQTKKKTLQNKESTTEEMLVETPVEIITDEAKDETKIIPLWKKLYKKSDETSPPSSSDLETPEMPIGAKDEAEEIQRLRQELEYSRKSLESMSAKLEQDRLKNETELAIRLVEKNHRRCLQEERDALLERVKSFEQEEEELKKSLEVERSLRLQTQAQSAGKDALGKGLHKPGNTAAVLAYREMLQSSDKHCDKCLMTLTAHDETHMTCRFCRLMATCWRCPKKDPATKEDLMREHPRLRLMSASLSHTLDLPPEYSYHPTPYDCSDCAQYCRFCDIKYRDPPHGWVPFSICESCARI